MPWLRVSDTVAYDPVVVAVLEHPDADERTADELFGFVVRLATLSAQHATDYVSTYSTALVLGGAKPRTDRLLALAEFAGYGVNEVEEESGRRRFRLIDDPKFLHMKTAEELAWEQQRKADNSSPHVVVPVRHRDGDACRYCGKVVNWSDRTGGIGGTYDHRPPGEPANAQTSVVACRSCNSERGAVGRGLPPQEALAAADAVRPLWDVPPVPYYKPATRAWLARNEDVLALYGLVPPPPARTKKVIEAGTLAPGVVRPAEAAPAPDGVRPAEAVPAPDVRARNAESVRAGPAPPHKKHGPTCTDEPPEEPAGRKGAEVGVAGSGRDGSGRAGVGLAGPGRGGAGGAQPSPRRRRRRGRRGGNREPASGGQG